MGRVTRGLKSVLKPLVDVRSWLGWDRFRDSIGFIKKLIVDLFVPQKQEVTESFEDSLRRLNLTEEHLRTRLQEFKRLAWIYFVLLCLSFLYLLYHGLSGHFLGLLVMIGISSVLVSMVFKFHFWQFQLRKRKLGCTFREWLDEAILGKK